MTGHTAITGQTATGHSDNRTHSNRSYSGYRTDKNRSLCSNGIGKTGRTVVTGLTLVRL